MKLLITGSKGQLGTELVRQAMGHDVVAVDHDELDITDAAAVSSFVGDVHPDVIINAAAYTAVDRAEEDVDTAFAVNRDGPAHLAKACSGLNIPLIHVSTDYVFAGNRQGAYVESDPVEPAGVYGESKLAGEQAVTQCCSRYLILRTSWVFSSHGNNFVKTMLRLGRERETLGVVADQFGKPTAAAELARLILAILPDSEGHWGTYHLAQPDATSWHGFAEVIFDTAREQGVNLKVNRVNAITTDDYPTPAKRPANSVLDCSTFESTFGFKIRPWRDSLNEVVKELKGQ